MSDKPDTHSLMNFVILFFLMVVSIITLAVIILEERASTALTRCIHRNNSDNFDKGCEEHLEADWQEFYDSKRMKTIQEALRQSCARFLLLYNPHGHLPLTDHDKSTHFKTLYQEPVENLINKAHP